MRILLADGQPNVRSALGRLLKHEPGVEVDVQETGAANFLLISDDEIASPVASSPDIAVVMNNPSLLVIVLSGRPEACQTALAAGANAFVSKIDPPEKLLETLHDINSKAEEIESRTGLS